MSCNLNRGGDGWHGTRKELKHVEDRQACARVPRGGVPRVPRGVYQSHSRLATEFIRHRKAFSPCFARMLLHELYVHQENTLIK